MTGAEQLKAFAEFYSINNSYSFSNNFEEITKNYTDTIPGEVSEVDKIRSIIDQKKEQLNKLNSQIDKISPLIGSQIATELRFMVNQCLSTLDSLGERLTDFSNDMSIENWNEVIKYVAKKRAIIQAKPNANRDELLKLMRTNNL